MKTTFVNRSFADHPMHLHGHHVQVISKNGKTISGSPLVLDTVNIEPGEKIEVAFLANNPGLCSRRESIETNNNSIGSA